VGVLKNPTEAAAALEKMNTISIETARELFRTLRRDRQPRWLVDPDVTPDAARDIGSRFAAAGRGDEWTDVVREWIRECNGHVPADCAECGARFTTNWPLERRYDPDPDGPSMAATQCWRCVRDAFDGESLAADPDTTGEIDARYEGGCGRSGCMWRAFFYERVVGERLVDRATLHALEDRYADNVRRLDCADCGRAFVWMYDYAEEPPVAYAFERDRLNTTHCAECARERAYAAFETDAFVAQELHTMSRAGLRRFGVDVPDPPVSESFAAFLDERFGDFWRCDPE